ncbi:hypothetical protein Tco_0412838 [Tanacetum coccineum]
MESIVDVTELFRKLKLYPLAKRSKDIRKVANYHGLTFFPVSPESDDTFMSLQALSNLHYLFSGFMDYFYSPSELTSPIFGPTKQ